MFLGTPDGRTDIARALGNDTTLLETSTKTSPILREVAQGFEAFYTNVDIVQFCETIQVCLHSASH